MRIIIVAKRPKVTRVVDAYLLDALNEAKKLAHTTDTAHPCSVSLVSIGSCSSRTQLKQALALGIEKGIHITTPDSLNAYTVSELLLDVIQHEQPDVIILTEELANTQQHTGQMLSSLLSHQRITSANTTQHRLLLIREMNSGAYSVAIPASEQTNLAQLKSVYPC